MDSPQKHRKASVYHRAVRGGAWVAITRISQQVLAVVRLFILAKLLDPRDFGLMSIALLSISILDLFSNMGLSEAIIQKKEDISRYLNVAWSSGIVRGVLLFVLLFITAPYIAAFFDAGAQFEPAHLQKPQLLVLRLQQASDDCSRYLYPRLRPGVQALIERYQATESVGTEIKESLTYDLNRIINQEKLWQQDCFARAADSRYVKQTLNTLLAKQDTHRANRIVLEEAFDGLIQKVVMNRELTAWIIRLVGFSFLIGAFPNIGTLYLQKNLTFGRIFVLRIAGTIADTTVSIILAFLLRSAWALVFGRLTMVFVVCILSYWAHPFRPRWLMDFTLLKNLFGYGKHLLGASIVRFIATRGDAIFVGRLLGTASLGLHQFAMKISTTAFGEISETMNQVSFPAFADLQGNIAKLRAGYIRSVQVLTMLGYPVSGAMLILPGEFTSILLGAKWMPIVPVIQVFCLLGPVQTVQADSVYKSLGRPDIQFKLSTLRFVLLMLAIYPMTKMYGITGAALAVLLTAAIVTPINLNYIKGLINFSMWDYIKLVSLPALAAALMMTALLALKHLLPITGYVTLAFAAAVGAAVYLGAFWALSRMYPQYRVFELLRDVGNVFFRQKR